MIRWKCITKVKEKTYIQYNEGRITALVTLCIEIALENTLFEER